MVKGKARILGLYTTDDDRNKKGEWVHNKGRMPTHGASFTARFTAAGFGLDAL